MDAERIPAMMTGDDPMTNPRHSLLNKGEITSFKGFICIECERVMDPRVNPDEELYSLGRPNYDLGFTLCKEEVEHIPEEERCPERIFTGIEIWRAKSVANVLSPKEFLFSISNETAANHFPNYHRTFQSMSERRR